MKCPRRALRLEMRSIVANTRSLKVVHRKVDEIFEIGGSVSVAQIEGHPIQAPTLGYFKL